MPETLKKKVVPGAIQLDEDENGIIVHYETQEVVTHEDGSSTVLSTLPAVKKIKVGELPQGTSFADIAEEIVDKCKLIHPSKLPLVQELLEELQHQRRTAAELLKCDIQSGPGSEEGQDGPNGALDQPDLVLTSLALYNDAIPPAHPEDLEEYIEALYEDDIREKIRATSFISALFRRADLIEDLLCHETLLATLARVLRDDGKRAVELCINILSVFFALSMFSQFHGCLSENQIGALTMDITDLELQRAEHREKEEDVSLCALSHRAARQPEPLTERERKLVALQQRQDRLLYIACYLLLNLAEDVFVEVKMKKKDIVGYLVRLLDRTSVELLVVVVGFLKKLSIYEENKARMAECAAVPRLMRLLASPHEPLLAATLSLLHNLSFDAAMRDEMVRQGFVTKAMTMLHNPRTAVMILGILYHISMEDRHKSAFAGGDSLAVLQHLLLQAGDFRSAPELIALAVNLTQNARVAEAVGSSSQFDAVVAKAVESGDELLFKVVRNVSQLSNMDIKTRVAEHADDMVVLLQEHSMEADLVVEVLGTLANLAIPGFDYAALVARHGLLAFLRQLLAQHPDDDVLLEVAILAGVLCTEETAPQFAEEGLVGALFALMTDKREDDEFVLQLTLTFQQLLIYRDTRATLLETTELVGYLVDLLRDKHREVARAADGALDVVMDTSEEWAVRIRTLKFEAHSSLWLDIVMRGIPPPESLPGADDSDGSSDEDDLAGAHVNGLFVDGHRIMDFSEYASQQQLWEQQQQQMLSGGHFENAVA